MDLNKYLDLISNDYRDHTPEEILHEYDQFTSGINPFLLPTQFHIPNLAVYRARLWNQEGMPTKVQECSYKAHTVDYGRCHIPQHPVFYGCENPFIVPHEIGARVGDYLIFGRWTLTITKDMYVAFLTYGLRYNNDINYQFNEFLNANVERHYRSENQMGITFDDYKLRLKVFNHLFLANNYKLTGTIAHNLMYPNKFFPKPVEVLVYASMAQYGRGHNYAIHENICTETKNRLIPIKFYRKKITGYHDKIYTFEVSHVGTPISGNIHWEIFNQEKHQRDMIVEGIISAR